MPVVNRIADLAPEIAEWRQDFHRNPELLYDVHRTAGVVADKLRGFGCDEVVTGIGRTGLVAVIHGRNRASGKIVGLRADMDALPIEETADRPWKSQKPGLMHACGHDGHTAMLLGAARYLAETRNFDGTAVLIFQPAEEGGAGGLAMVEDGLMERFGIQEVYAMHNMPGVPLGAFAMREGAIMAAGDRFEIEVIGVGGHAAKPYETVDPIVIGAQIVGALQTIPSRNVHPLDSCVVTVTQFHAGTTHNIIPGTAAIQGTIRTLTPRVRDLAERRMREIAGGIAAAHGASVDIFYKRGYPVLENHAAETREAARIAGDIVGPASVNIDATPTMGGEDFAYMLQKRPGAMIFLGNGSSHGLHHPEYDFDDRAIPYGVSFWARLVETRMPA